VATSTAGSGAAVEVRTVQSATSTQSGLVSVAVPPQEGAFVAPLPQDLLPKDGAGASQPVRASLENGAPLPAWLQLDTNNMSLVATNVPDNGLPLRVMINVGGTNTVVVITQSAKVEN
jgi:hypothetical protein